VAVLDLNEKRRGLVAKDIDGISARLRRVERRRRQGRSKRRRRARPGAHSGQLRRIARPAHCRPRGPMPLEILSAVIRINAIGAFKD